MAAIVVLAVFLAGAMPDAGKGDTIEISLERTECFGPCPVYKVSISADGTVVYTGRKNVERVGTFVGQMDEEVFERLDTLASELGILELKDKYTSPFPDQSHAITTVVRGELTKRIDNYGDVAPPKLWAFEMLIDAAVSKIKDWKELRQE